MKKRFHIFIGLILILSLISQSCILDPKERPDGNPVPVPVVWPDLKEKDDIFEYLEKVYENRSTSRYPLLLNEDFTFFFGDDDFNNNIVTDRFWHKTRELSSATNMFEGATNPKYGSITSISVNLTPEGPWIEKDQTEPPYVGEKWYERTAEYTIIVQTDKSYTLQGKDLKGLFVVRQAVIEADTIWQLIQWHDDVGSGN